MGRQHPGRQTVRARDGKLLVTHSRSDAEVLLKHPYGYGGGCVCGWVFFFFFFCRREVIRLSKKAAEAAEAGSAWIWSKYTEEQIKNTWLFLSLC